MKRPNILFILTDQLRPDHTGFGGNDIVKTPNLDKLAAKSRRFTRAYCPTPSCGPSRNSIMTGRMPSTNGSWTNALSLDPDANTFPRVLHRSGYHTGLIGKSHLQDCINRTPGEGGVLDLSKLNLKPCPPEGEGRAVERPWMAQSDWDKYERHWFHAQGPVEMPEDYYGFSHVELTMTHNDKAGGHHYWWVKEQGGDPDSFGGVENAVKVSPDWNQIWESNTPLEYYSTTYIKERSINYIEQHAADDDPFLLVASFPDPHHPFALARTVL